MTFYLKKLLTALLLVGPLLALGRPALPFFAGANPAIQYTGRVVEGSAPGRVRYWASGVYWQVRFSGPRCQVLVADEQRYGTSHNYLTLVVDGRRTRLRLRGALDTLTVAENLGAGLHELLVCKDTEAAIGYVEVLGLRCQRLLPPSPRPAHRLECIGNSITCGMGADTAAIGCGRGQWYDQHNAYLAYGPRTARALGAGWQLTCESGIGLVHSCCDKPNLMPQEVFTVDLRPGGLPWNASRYQPDVVTICLGQNDGVQDSVTFCGAYVAFLRTLRHAYPQARLVCLTSPMADERLAAVLRRYLAGVVAAAHAGGDAQVSSYAFVRRYHAGCGNHPSLAEHALIADELTAYLRQLTGW